MSVFEKRKGVVAVSDPTIAAALLSRSNFWGNKPADRRRGPSTEFKPCNYNGKETFKHHRTGKIRVLFLIAGDVEDMTIRRRLFHTGQLYVNGKDWRKWRDDLLAEIHKARENINRMTTAPVPEQSTTKGKQ